tara:strand:+ start:109 stop:462 length:354 start_codon:yes stop_codon:yes gene_type:complete
MILGRPDDHFVTQSSGTKFLLPVLLPVDSIHGSLRFLRGFRQAHNLKVAGSNPAPATAASTLLVLGKGSPVTFDSWQRASTSRRSYKQSATGNGRHVLPLAWFGADLVSLIDEMKQP